MRQESTESIESSMSSKTMDSGISTTSDVSTNTDDIAFNVEDDLNTLKCGVADIKQSINIMFRSMKKIKPIFNQWFRGGRTYRRRSLTPDMTIKIKETLKHKECKCKTPKNSEKQFQKVASTTKTTFTRTQDENSDNNIKSTASVMERKENEASNLTIKTIEEFEGRGKLISEDSTTDDSVMNIHENDEVSDLIEKTMVDLERRGELTFEDLTAADNITPDIEEQLKPENATKLPSPKQEYRTEVDDKMIQNKMHPEQLEGEDLLSDYVREEEDVSLQSKHHDINSISMSDVRCSIQKDNEGNKSDPDQGYGSLEDSNDSNNSSEPHSNFSDVNGLSDMYQGHEPPETQGVENSVSCHVTPCSSSAQVKLLSSQLSDTDDEDLQTDGFNNDLLSSLPSAKLLKEALLPNVPVLEKVVSNSLQVVSENYAKSQGSDTVIIWDVSGSICEKTFMQMKTIITDFVKYAEDVTTNYGIEENIGIVIIGSTTEILCPLTNDYSMVLDKIESVGRSGGTTPLTLGLLLSHIMIDKKGGPTSICGYYIPPRIVVVSDGRPTEDAGLLDQSLEMSPKDLSVQQRALAFCRELYTHGYQIFCVSVGLSANKPFLEEMAFAGEGKVFPMDNLMNLYKHFLHQSMVGNVIANCKINGKEAEYIIMVRQHVRRQNATTANPMLDETDEQIIIEEIEKSEELFYEEISDLPHLGSRIRRGQTQQNQANSLPDKDGTVVSHQSATKTFKVSWDDLGEITQHNQHSIIVNEIELLDRPRVLDNNHILQLGAKVIKHVDQEFEAEMVEHDENSTAIGHVFQVTDSGIVRVRWSGTPASIERHDVAEFNGRHMSIHPDSTYEESFEII